MRKAAPRIPAGRLWINPDCGLKTTQLGRSAAGTAQYGGCGP